jgi:anti-sigma regulatory factor (Ser/Thr protein kinase)
VNTNFTATFDPAVETPALARHELEGWLPDSLPEQERSTLRLLVSELVTNSVRHVSDATRPVVLALRLGARAIRVEVHDGGAGFTPGTPKPRGADGGFGLFLVERMASRWGVDIADGTRVWFELDLPSDGD